MPLVHVTSEWLPPLPCWWAGHCQFSQALFHKYSWLVFIKKTFYYIKINSHVFSPVDFISCFCSWHFTRFHQSRLTMDMESPLDLKGAREEITAEEDKTRNLTGAPPIWKQTTWAAHDINTSSMDRLSDFHFVFSNVASQHTARVRMLSVVQASQPGSHSALKRVIVTASLHNARMHQGSPIIGDKDATFCRNVAIC